MNHKKDWKPQQLAADFLYGDADNYERAAEHDVEIDAPTISPNSVTIGA
jgi:hypothetical protein